MQTEVKRVLYAVEIYPFTQADALRMASEAARLKRQNRLIGFRDLTIACVALTYGLPVATLNENEFSRVEGLRLFKLASDTDAGSTS